MNGIAPQSHREKPSEGQSEGPDAKAPNWDALFLKRTEQTAFSMLWMAVIAGCIWYFVTARGVQTIDIDQAPAQSARFLVEINSASKHEFDCLPGIGPKTALAITNWREDNGPFKSIDSMAEVPGVSPRLLEKLKPFLYFDAEEVTQR